jgi:hypothetical protein
MCKWDLLNTGMDETKPIDLEKKKTTTNIAHHGRKLLHFYLILEKQLLHFYLILEKQLLIHI